MNKFILPVLILGGLAACQSTKNNGNNDINTSAKETISMDYMDLSVRPQDDFFQFANGTWVKNNPVPPSESRWGSFNELDQANMSKLTAILEDAKTNGKKEDGTKLIGDYYASYIDMDQRNALGIEPIREIISKIRVVDEHNDLPQILALMHERGIGAGFSFGVTQDMKSVENHLLYFGQGGLTLPNRNYYTEEEYEEIREAYTNHISQIGMLAEMDAAAAAKMSQDVFNFELEMAASMLRPEEMRLPANRYNKMGKKEALDLFSGFDFEEYLKATGTGAFDSINIGQKDYATFIGEHFASNDIGTVRNYLLWKALDHYAGHLNQDFVKANFEFYGKTMSGKSEMKPINERAIKEITQMDFGEMLGRAFVERHYSQEAQETINELVDNLLAVFEKRINGLDWMSSETKSQATKKLMAIGRKLGFPEEWKDYSDLTFNPKYYVQNIDQAAIRSHKENLDKLNKKVDTKEWGMPAHMVNAYYHPLLNEIAFPAGIMQPPFFSANYEDAVNYGRIGMVIGHEFTHGFDDNGSKFDADGNYKNWWTEEDRTLFDARTETLGNTFEQFCPIDGHCVNPKLTMGENIADLGGLTLAYHAYKLTDEYKSGKKRNGYTPAQRFFIAYAQLWKINYTDAEMKKRVATDPHSPGMYRVNGPLMNCPEFFEAFDVKEGDAMRNEESKVAKIW
ncbi:MAG: M13 family metallopeptidase [bacterium]|nr:M13 family metallopeptidase [bacterium]